MQTKEYKITLLGSPNCGKSLFIKRLIEGSNNVIYRDYIPTLGVDVTTIDININNNKIRLNIWDCAGDSRYRGLKDGYHIDTKAAIIFRKSNDNSYLDYENELPNEISKIYLDDYDIENPEYSVSYYKNLLFNFIITNI